MFQNEKEVKLFSKKLRTEIRFLIKSDFGTLDSLSHNKMLELVAKASGFKTYGHLLARLKSTPPVPLVESPLTYCLTNRDGSLDLVHNGILVTGLTLKLLHGTVEDILGCTAFVDEVNRDKLVAGEVDYAGETEVDWNGQQTRVDSRGIKLWYDIAYQYVAEDQCVIIPEDWSEPADIADFYDKERCLSYKVRIRRPLVAQIQYYLKCEKLTLRAIAELQDKASDILAQDLGESAQSALGRAQTAVGFALHALELENLAKRLGANKL